MKFMTRLYDVAQHFLSFHRRSRYCVQLVSHLAMSWRKKRKHNLRSIQSWFCSLTYWIKVYDIWEMEATLIPFIIIDFSSSQCSFFFYIVCFYALRVLAKAILPSTTQHVLCLFILQQNIHHSKKTKPRGKICVGFTSMLSVNLKFIPWCNGAIFVKFLTRILNLYSNFLISSSIQLQNQ